MKLSDAIRLGSMLRRQVRGDLFRDGGSCAMGAAYEAVGVPARDDSVYTDAELHMAIVWNRLKVDGGCPVCHQTFMYTHSICALIGHLNDLHLWTREAIADFVATIEPAESPALDPVPVTSSALGGEG